MRRRWTFRFWLCTGALAGLLCAIPSMSFATPDSLAEEGDPFGDVEEIIAVEEVVAIPDKKAELSAWVSRWHPLCAHFPVAWLVLLWIIDFYGLLWLRGRRFDAVGYWLAPSVVASFVPAMGTGFLRLRAFSQDLDTIDLALDHRNLMLAAFFSLVIAVFLRIKYRNHFDGKDRYLYFAFVTLAVGFTMYGGHLGGELVFGEDYLF